jgi:predicted transcriptional regulator
VAHQIIELTAKIVAAHVSAHDVATEELSGLIRDIYQALSTAGEVPVEVIRADPAVDPKKSVFADHIVCLDCGGSLKMLKRHLGAEHQLTPDQYRAKWGLPSSYPMVAAEYAQARSRQAKESGLGRNAEVAPPQEKKTVGRPKKV